MMWVEKYRPKRLDDVVNQREILEGIKNFVRKRDMPNLLFAGPAGVGKTTVALCIAREILGEYWRDNILELNASDERGINMVREKVKMFTRYTSMAEIPFKIVILDEADEMTPDAQTALRRIMEDSASTTRFILICNYIAQIIEPIQSRCVIFRFRSLSKEDVTNHLAKICRLEDVAYTTDALDIIYDYAKGDLRHSINIMQAAASFGAVNSNTVKHALGISHKAKVSELVELVMQGRFNDARIKMLELLRIHGLAESDLMKLLGDEIISRNSNGDMIDILAEYDYRLAVGAHPEIQLTALLAELSRVASSGKSSSGSGSRSGSKRQ